MVWCRAGAVSARPTTNVVAGLTARLDDLSVRFGDLEADNARLVAGNTVLREENAVLRAENTELRRRLGLTSKNSSKTPSSDGLSKRHPVARCRPCSLLH